MQSRIIQAEEKLIIETPERVQLEFALASIGNRFLAVAADHFIQYLSIFLIAWFVLSITGYSSSRPPESPNKLFEEMPKWTMAILVIVLFLIFAGYFIVFEWLGTGRRRQTNAEAASHSRRRQAADSMERSPATSCGSATQFRASFSRFTRLALLSFS